MKTYATTIEAINPATGKLTTWGGPNIPGISEADAQDFANTHGLGYCKVIGELVMEIPTIPGTTIPDMDNAIDYETPGLN